MIKLFLSITYYVGVVLSVFGLMSIYYSYSYYFMTKVLFVEWEIMDFASVSIIMTLIFDWMSLMFMGLVLLISSMVMFYSTFYMEGDKFFVRFILLVYLFVLSMVFLILSPNLISILLGWDGLGLVSYCLVIYYQNNKSANAGMITILSNRIGDVAILLGIAWLLNYGSWNFYYFQFIFNPNENLMLMGMVILAAMTKSAQMPFSAWLPAAMAAPTPVSALVHSSTLVTAGVYLLIRFNYMMGCNSFLFYIGVLTMFMSGLGANLENDLKKIIALSTLSQLGLMMMTLSLGFYEFSFFHLMTHAMFKSLLFLCAGVYIHSMGDTQDIRFMGCLNISCPVTSFYFMSASLALCGFPFLSGFYSSDMILELFFMGGSNFFMLLVVFGATMFTLMYSVRLMYFIFFNNMGSRGLLNLAEHVGMISPMSLLLMLSLFAGGWMSVNMFPVYLINLPMFLKIMVLVGLMFFSWLIFFMMENKLPVLGSSYKILFNYMGSMWFLPFLSSIMFMPLLKLGSFILKYADQGWMEYAGGQGAINKMGSSALSLDILSISNLKFYLFLIFILISLVFLLP
uniref:NADH-ubiquinone oxidoreductase chain 5 n=1 Tax=Cryptopygus antarcticus TaxID=187623 RepID=B2BSB9_CRYAT|nr:NADH dehydrogenase subunit 5 [Cryptopygus antarcticus]ABS57572.1 NADH dehydrogenase subunit 5 [Cryptopygus antarcticus]